MNYNQMPHAHNTRIALLIIILSLLLHTILMLVLILSKESAHLPLTRSEQHANEPEILFAQEQNSPTTPQQQSWTAHKAAASSWGAPAASENEEQTEDDTDELYQEPIIEQPTPINEQASESSSEESEQTESLAQQADATPQEISTHTPTNASIEKAVQTLSTQPQIRKTVAQHLVSQAPAVAPKTPPVSLPQTTGSKKSSMSLAQLSQGFLEYAHQEQGVGLVEVQGSGVQGMPSQEQLRHERYVQKIFWWIQKASYMNTTMQEVHATHRKIGWHMLLNRDGSIKTLTLVQSTGSTQIDRIIEEIIREASTSFPPVPTFFKEPYYMMRFTLMIEPYEKPSNSFSYRGR